MQEAIDIADFAVGQSRMLYGLSMHSERPGTPCASSGTRWALVGVITAFNFPMAVWAWNSMLAYVCGDAMLWKPSSETPRCAASALTERGADPVLEQEGFGPRWPR